MKEGQKLWTREELLLTINLYAKIPFGKMDHRNKDVQELASLIGRTLGAVARRLANFASLDPIQQSRGIKGLPNTGGLAEEVWKEFYADWDNSFEASEELLANSKQITTENLYDIDYSDIIEGQDKQRLVKTRINQYRFRQIDMANYNSTCCNTGIKEPQLLIASHITSWSKFKNNRLNPANGLCLNALHDKAFDNGLLTVTAEDYTILISPSLKKKPTLEVQDYFLKYDRQKIKFPKKFMPDPKFLEIHNEDFRKKLN
ncbi:HNH endonuclease [Pontibacter qinzhouensis]|uniref:HNH endonuclease n=1 Tax=Pontibacter qinzhouensis TaxID=2603253 RepID=A0A5C8JDL3_9BACT|nr:HNH endonuclease [Pontibacter qinzhouensis]TXK36460.1 HNH endonuclease [Pontibacter qinzhouensis]